MKIITNPDFFLLGYKSNKNKIKAILDAADDYVILGTFLPLIRKEFNVLK